MYVEGRKYVNTAVLANDRRTRRGVNFHPTPCNNSTCVWRWCDAHLVFEKKNWDNILRELRRLLNLDCRAVHTYDAPIWNNNNLTDIVMPRWPGIWDGKRNWKAILITKSYYKFCANRMKVLQSHFGRQRKWGTDAYITKTSFSPNTVGTHSNWQWRATLRRKSRRNFRMIVQIWYRPASICTSIRIKICWRLQNETTGS